MMCTGACILYGIPQVVIGENETFLGGEDVLKQHGVEVNTHSPANCHRLIFACLHQDHKSR